MKIIENFIQTICLFLAIFGITIMIYSDDSISVVKVGVIDSGVNVNHDFFKTRKITIVPLNSQSFLNQLDENGHGTHVAGIIARYSYSNTEIYSFKNIFEHSSNQMSSNDLKSDLNPYYIKAFEDFDVAIEQAYKNNIKILNISQYIIGRLSDYELQSLTKVFEKSLKYGIMIVVASGNQKLNLSLMDKNNNIYPCALNLANMICVGNVDQFNNIYSNYGKGKVDIFANGVQVLSPINENGKFAFQTGSSQASPKIAGLISQIWAKNPEYSVDEVKAQLFKKLTYDKELAKKSTYGLYLKE